MCSDALEAEPECLELLLVRARAHIALRRELEAQADLRDIIRIEPRCSPAYRLLGELAARRAENESAAIFFREALRLDPDDAEAREWLALVTPARPAAAVKKLPAPAAAAGRVPRTARGTQPPEEGRGPVPELPGFAEHLVAEGILSRDRLRAAQAYQRSMRVPLSTAIVALGLATPQRIEWAAVAHQTSLARGK